MKELQSLLWKIVVLVIVGSHAAIAAQADSWKADWEKTVEAAKKEGQITLYGSPDFEGLFGEFHKKYPEIKITGVFNRGADVAKRLMAERRGEKYLADLYVDGMTTGYNVFIRRKCLIRSRRCWCFLKLPTSPSGGAASFITSIRRTSICSTSTGKIVWSSRSTPNW